MTSCLTLADLAVPVIYTHHACRNGVEVLINTKVESIDHDTLTLVRQDKEEKHSQTVAYGACVWATGVAMHPLTKHLQEAMPPGTQSHSRSSHACFTLVYIA